MRTDLSLNALEDNAKKKVILVFCGEQFSNDPGEKTIREIINRAVLSPANTENVVCELHYENNTESEREDASPTMLQISEILCDLGIPASLLGYEYLRFAIHLALTDRKCLFGITKILYPTVAEEFNTSASRVERAIRHAIEVACNRGDIDVFRKIFRNTISPNTGKPTNSEFISKIADRLRMNDPALSAVPAFV